MGKKIWGDSDLHPFVKKYTKGDDWSIDSSLLCDPRQIKNPPRGGLRIWLSLWVDYLLSNLANFSKLFMTIFGSCPTIPL